MNNKSARKHRISIKQAKLLAAFHDQDRLSTEDTRERLGWEYQDTRNQLKALMEKGLMDIYDQDGRTHLYGITPNGMRTIAEVLKDSAIVKPGLPTVVPNVGNGSDWANISPKSQPTLVSLLEKMNEIRAIFGEWPELAKLVGSLLPGPRTQA